MMKMWACRLGLLIGLIAVGDWTAMWGQGNAAPTVDGIKPAPHASGAVDRSRAHSWAELVAEFMADPKIGRSFPAVEAARQFRTLLPAESFRTGINGGFALRGDLEKGIVGIRYALDDEPHGAARISWVTLYMPQSDPDGVDVMSRVIAVMKTRLRRPWRGYPNPGNGFYWEQRQTLWTLHVEKGESHPSEDGTPNAGPWVTVNLARVPGFETEP